MDEEIIELQQKVAKQQEKDLIEKNLKEENKLVNALVDNQTAIDIAKEQVKNEL